MARQHRGASPKNHLARSSAFNFRVPLPQPAITPAILTPSIILASAATGSHQTLPSTRKQSPISSAPNGARIVWLAATKTAPANQLVSKTTHVVPKTLSESMPPPQLAPPRQQEADLRAPHQDRFSRALEAQLQRQPLHRPTLRALRRQSRWEGLMDLSWSCQASLQGSRYSCEVVLIGGLVYSGIQRTFVRSDWLLGRLLVWFGLVSNGVGPYRYGAIVSDLSVWPP